MNKFPYTFKGRKHTEETKLKMSIARNLWYERNPDFVFKINYGRKLSEKTKKKIALSVSLAHKEGRLNTLEWRERHSEFMKKRFADGFNPMRGRKHKPETIAHFKRIRVGINCGKENPMYGMCGELAPSWMGGTSFIPYGREFNFNLKELIRNRFDRCCMICFAEESGICLDVHHVDYDKRNNSINNLVSLHAECHKKTRMNRNGWIKYFKELIRCHQKFVSVTTNQIFCLVELQPN